MHVTPFVRRRRFHLFNFFAFCLFCRIQSESRFTYFTYVINFLKFDVLFRNTQPKIRVSIFNDHACVYVLKNIGTPLVDKQIECDIAGTSAQATNRTSRTVRGE